MRPVTIAALAALTFLLPFATTADARPIPSGAARSFEGVASHYWQGKKTANGESYNPDGITAAHRTLPFGTRVKVTDKASGRSVVVRINDRGPFIGGRVIDLSRGAAKAIGMTSKGIGRVRVEVLG
jgi:rare lipoprotein A